MRNAQEYLDTLARLPRPYRFMPPAHGRAQRRESDLIEANTREFASANLHHLLPEIPLRAHPQIIDEILLHRLMAELDGAGFFLLDKTQVEDPHSVLTTAQTRPVVFCTFHLGSYRLITMFLIKHGLNFLVPLEDYSNQQPDISSLLQSFQREFASPAEFKLVNAEEPTAALAMARKARVGWSLLAYIDGNTGVQGAARKDAKMLKLSLLGKPIVARKGIAFLSHFLKLPIVPVFCEILGPVERRLVFHDPIQPPEAGSDRDAYCRQATEQLYGLLGRYLKKSPSQWLGWLDMQQYLDLDATLPFESAESIGQATESEEEVAANRLVFNHERFGFIVRDGERVVLDKLTYEFLSVPESVYAVLEACKEPVTMNKYMPESHKETIEQLLSLKLLTPVADPSAARTA